MTESSPIISYIQLVTKEGQSLQRGMNFRINGRPSVFLMSTKKNAPYKDAWESENLIYEGHDIATRLGETANKKTTDQPMFLPSGRLTENGKFFKAAKAYKNGKSPALKIQVYEKLDAGVWFDKGIFELVDAKQVDDDNRSVFKFYLHPTNEVVFNGDQDYKHERLIPSWVKVEVWRRDKGKCTTCGASDGLHYDHILPFSRGGRSDDPKNIQILCARHNLQKSSRIE
jgi:hypothetical protein